MRHQINTKTLSAKEVAFLAEQEPIYILPRYTMNGIELIGNDMPKLKALQRREVSLWLAILLKKQNKCNIVIPEWLSLPYLKAKLKEEEKRKERVTELPWHWIPVSKILLDICPDDFIDSPHELRSLIQDLREIRMLKLRQGFSMIDDEYLEMTGLSLMEINEVRPFLLKTMDKLRDLKKVSIDDDEEEEQEDQEKVNEHGQQDDEIFDNSHINNISNNNNDEIQQQQQQQQRSNNISDDDIGGKHSGFNTSGLGNDSTLVEFDNSTSMAAPYHTTKRRRIEHKNNKDSKNNKNNNSDGNSDSDSDPDIEYRD